MNIYLVVEVREVSQIVNLLVVTLNFLVASPTHPAGDWEWKLAWFGGAWKTHGGPACVAAIKCDRRWAEKQGEGLPRDWDEKFIRGFGHFTRTLKIKKKIHWHSFKIQRSWKELTILLLQVF